MVGPSFDESFADSHIATVAISTTMSIGKYEIKPSKADEYDSLDISKLVAMAPGPAINGMDRGNIAIDFIVSSSMAVSAVFCLLVCLCSKTI